MPGGVCAVLDYEVEPMAEYVAEMTTRLALNSGAAPSAFRKFISQILTSTRLPRTTILLGMNYLSKRINMMNMNGNQSKMSDGQIWRMLTVALLLGSKFLDDNTFQNRSWAEVSGIPVRELNTLEHEWMDVIDWNLYVNLDQSADYNAWLKSWRDWSDNKKRLQSLTSRERLASLVPAIETDVSRPRNNHAYNAWHQQQVAELERYESMKRNEQTQRGFSARDSAWRAYDQRVLTWPSSPLTPPDSGYGTPDYMDAATSASAQYNDWFSQQNRAIGNNPYIQPQQFAQGAAPNNYHGRNQPSAFGLNYYGPSIWQHHSPPNCRCPNCISVSPQHAKQPYFNAVPSFG